MSETHNSFFQPCVVVRLSCSSVCESLLAGNSVGPVVCLISIMVTEQDSNRNRQAHGKVLHAEVVTEIGGARFVRTAMTLWLVQPFHVLQRGSSSRTSAISTSSAAEAVAQESQSRMQERVCSLQIQNKMAHNRPLRLVLFFRAPIRRNDLQHFHITD